MFTKHFWLDAAERVGSTAIQVFVAGLVVTSGSDVKSLQAAGIAAALSATKAAVVELSSLLDKTEGAAPDA